MARIRIVPAKDLSQKDLRASKYVGNPQREAKDVVVRWCLFTGLSPRGESMNKLRQFIEEALRARG